jgi:hypothetical protein
MSGLFHILMIYLPDLTDRHEPCSYTLLSSLIERQNVKGLEREKGSIAVAID